MAKEKIDTIEEELWALYNKIKDDAAQVALAADILKRIQSIEELLEKRKPKS